jgi:uncharacterized membrane protein
MGWIMEVIVTIIKDKELVNRGFLIGPYCPIYGVCSIVMILLLSKVHDPFLLFILSIIICSVGEYITSYILEKIFKARWWDYSYMKFNINGRICLRNCAFFGILGFLVVKYINTFFLEIYSSFNILTLNIVFYTLISLFVIDIIVSCNVLLKIKDMSVKYINLDNTKEITEKVKKIISSKLLPRRLIKAFPNFKILIKKQISKLRGNKKPKDKEKK